MRLPWQMVSRRPRYKPLLHVPFYGQDTLLAALHEHLQAAKAGPAQFVTLAGPAGSGKSALLTEFTLLHGASPDIFWVSVNAATCLLAHDFYRQLFTALRERSERILQTIYNDTKHVRKTQGLTWDEKEFSQVIASTDWSQVDAVTSAGQGTARRALPLAPLLISVRQHPWAVAAATLLDTMSRGGAAETPQRTWSQRWAALLHAIRFRVPAGETVGVIVIDQLEATLSLPPTVLPTWEDNWQAFATVITGSAIPWLVIWSGTTDSVHTVQQLLPHGTPVAAHCLSALEAEASSQVVQRALRAVPRALQASWQRCLTQAQAAGCLPDQLLLATACVAAGERPSSDTALAELAHTDMTTLVSDVVHSIRQQHPALAALWQQLLEAWAFLPPGQHLLIEDLLPLCDLETLGLTPVEGRSGIETLLGQCVRYGLLQYDPYTSRYTTGHSRIQWALQRLVCPEESAQQVMALRRRLAAAVLYHVQHNDRTALGELARLLRDLPGGEASTVWTPLLIAPLRRLLPARVKAERQQIATALGGFTSPLAIELLRLMLTDEEGQVRSGVVQSLADLAQEATLPVLLEALTDPNSDVRWIATQALGHIRTAAAVDALIPMLTDDDKEVGRIAAEGLGRQGDSRAVPHLIAAMRESYPLLRESAALALGQLADKRALPALQEMLHDTNRQVRRSAEKALACLAAAT
jgi:hypothetical protein